MRVYALLLGVTLTAGYGYAAQMAVASLGAARQGEKAPVMVAEVARTEPLWYGGVLDPITVEARATGPVRVRIAPRLLIERPAARCAQSRQTSRAVL